MGEMAEYLIDREMEEKFNTSIQIERINKRLKLFSDFNSHTTLKGQTLKINEMENSHLINTLRHTIKKLKESEKENPIYFKGARFYISRFVLECNLRNINIDKEIIEIKKLLKGSEC